MRHDNAHLTDASKSETVGIGVVGTGSRIAHIIRNIPGFGDRIRVTALHDTHKEFVDLSLDSYAPDATVYDDYNDLVCDPSVDWVLIGSWNRLHAEQAIAAFEAGKHVFCEKPLANTLEDTLAMRAAHRRSGTLFMIGFTLRYSPHYRRIKEIVSSGKIGTIVSMEFNETLDFNHGGYIHSDWRRLRELAGSHLLEKCSHDLDVANWIAGSLVSRVASFGGLRFFVPENVYHQERIGPDPATGRPAFQTWRNERNPFTCDKDIVDHQVAILEYANGIRATFHTNCVAGIPERRMYIIGSEGTIRSDVIPGTIEVRRYGWNTEVENHDSGVSESHGGGDEVLVQSLSDVMLHGSQPPTSLEDGLTSAVTAFAIDDAMELGAVVDMAPYWDRVEADAPSERTRATDAYPTGSSR